MPLGTLTTSDDLLICFACGTQYDTTLENQSNSSTITTTTSSSSSSSLSSQLPPATIGIPASQTPLKSCRICDDPRQFVPASGQSFSTLARMRSASLDFDSDSDDRRDGKGYRNVFRRREEDKKVVELWTEPKFGIGQRACIIQTPHGNVMWDMVAYIDQNTVDQINELGGLEFIIISHPHFYTTWPDWSTTFSCPVYMAQIDAERWANRIPSPSSFSSVNTAIPPRPAQLKFITESHTTLLPGLTAIKAGGHFPGSMALHSSPPNTEIPSLFTADTIMAVPSGLNPDLKYHQPDTGIVSYTFIWSIPNMIPLDPDTILGIWNALKSPEYEFRASYSVLAGMGVQAFEGESGLRRRVLESMKVFLRRSGWKDHALFRETLS